jgi:hypothetical protein
VYYSSGIADLADSGSVISISCGIANVCGVLEELMRRGGVVALGCQALWVRLHPLFVERGPGSDGVLALHGENLGYRKLAQNENEEFEFIRTFRRCCALAGPYWAHIQFLSSVRSLAPDFSIHEL